MLGPGVLAGLCDFGVSRSLPRDVDHPRYYEYARNVMAREHIWLQVLRSVQLVTVSSSPFESGARSATEACTLLEERGVAINLATLRWFQNVGLIDKPTKEGRNAIYPRAILDEVASVRVLQNLYGRIVEDLLELRRRGVTFTEVVQHLLRLQEAQSARGKAAKVKMLSPAWEEALDRLGLVSEFFERVLREGVHPGRLILKGSMPLTVGVPGRRGR